MTILRKLSDLIAVLAAANRSAAAVEGHRTPRRSDLELLGIKADTFAAINRA